MPRFQIEEEHENHERWLVSYADFITLLFAFFVVMYAISSVNEGKYRVLSSTLMDVFTNTSGSISPIDFGGSSEVSLLEQQPDPSPRGEAETGDGALGEGEVSDQQMQALGEQIEEAMYDLIADDQIAVKSNQNWLEVSLNSEMLFAPGSAELHPKAKKIIAQIGHSLAEFPNAIKVEGFTDNVPIETEYYPSNWELSGARAASVVRVLARAGVDPSRMAAIGYGEFQPFADNSSEAGRKQNRRVVLHITRETRIRPPVDEVEQQDLSTSDDIFAAGELNLGKAIENSEQRKNSRSVAPETSRKSEAASGKTEPLTSGNEEDLFSGTRNTGDARTTTSPERKAGSQSARPENVNVVELDGGGLLFTNDQPGEPDR